MNKMQGFLQNVRSLFAASLHLLNADLFSVRFCEKYMTEEGFFTLFRLRLSSVVSPLYSTKIMRIATISA